MNYKRIYDALIANAQSTDVEGYTERHHIVPKCMSGGDEASNIVALTAREHFLAHLLLAKIYGGGLWYAVVVMKKGAQNSRLYEIVRRGWAASRVGIPLSFSHREKIATAQRKPETRARQSTTLKSAWADPEFRITRTAAQTVAMNRPEVKAKLSAAIKLAHARPEVKAKYSAAIKLALNRPEVKAKHSAATKLALNRPEVKTKHSAATKLALNRPEVRAKISATLKANSAAKRACFLALAAAATERLRFDKQCIELNGLINSVFEPLAA